MKLVVPDVAAVGEVICPCGQYRITAELLEEVGWAGSQVVSPCCTLVLELIPTGGKVG